MEKNRTVTKARHAVSMHAQFSLRVYQMLINDWAHVIIAVDHSSML